VRPILIVVLLAAVAQAKDVDWAGGWTKDGGGGVVVSAGPQGTLTLDEHVPTTDGQSVGFVGSGSGNTLTMAGRFTETVGYVGAIDGQKGQKQHTCGLTATERRDGDDQVADVTYTVDGSQVRSETWRRPLPPIEIELEEGNAPLAGPIDGKLSTTGLQVVYTVHGSDPLQLTLEITVDAGHPCPEFYANPTLSTQSLGVTQPGKHTATWDLRDQTAAARLAIQGCYKARVSASKALSAEATFTVAAPHFVVVGTPPCQGVAGGAGGTSAVLGPIMSGKGYDASLPAATTPAGIPTAVGNAAFAVFHAHGTPTTLAIAGVTTSTLSASAFGSLKDLHVAAVVACWTGGDSGDPQTPCFLQGLVDRGCDVAIGFRSSVLAFEAADWVSQFCMLLERGSPIVKTAQDTAKETLKRWWSFDPPVDDADLDRVILVLKARRASSDVEPCAASMTVLYGSGVTSAEQYWPPRYGNSKN
jgi:hypothetical protein